MLLQGGPDGPLRALGRGRRLPLDALGADPASPHRQALKTKLKNSPSWIHYSHDMWTAPNKTAYMAIVAHFIDSDTQRVAKALIALCEFKGTHSGETMASTFLEVLNEYEICESVGFITMDNASPNNEFMRHIARQLDPSFDPEIRRIRCFGHVLNLAVQAFLFGPKKW